MKKNNRKITFLIKNNAKIYIYKITKSNNNNKKNKQQKQQLKDNKQQQQTHTINNNTIKKILSVHLFFMK